MSVNKKYYLLIGLTIVLGFIFKLLIVHSQPLCLDEKYSIFYATQFDYLVLIKNFSVDVHPGFYYLLLKGLLEFTQDPIVLRTLSSVLPQMLGAFLLSWFYLKRNRKKEALLLSLIFTFNPFFNHLSFQLRSYSLIFLITIVVHLLICLWQETRKKKFLFVIFFLLILANLTHYVMYIFSFFVLIFLSLNLRISNLKKSLFIIFTNSLMIAQFFFFNGFSSHSQYKEQFQDAGWIALPSFFSIPKVYLTSLGMDTDVMNVLRGNIFLPSLFFYSIILIILIILIKKKPTISLSLFSKKIMILSIIPLLTIPFLSYFITFLSHRFFINQFVPRISLFIPRILLPFVIFLWIFLVNKLFFYWDIFKHKIKVIIIFILSSTLIFYWVLLNYDLNIKNFCSNNEQAVLLQILQKNQALGDQFNLWPHWMWIEAIQPNNLKDISIISDQKTKDKKFEQLFIDRSYLLDCNELNSGSVYSYTGGLFSQEKLQNEIISLLDKCCVQQDKIGLFKSWKCGY